MRPQPAEPCGLDHPRRSRRLDQDETVTLMPASHRPSYTETEYSEWCGRRQNHRMTALVCDAPWALPMVRRAPASAVAPLVPVHWCRRVQNEKSPMAVLPFSSQLSELQMSAQK